MTLQKLTPQAFADHPVVLVEDVVGTKKNRYEKAHQKGSGFGLVTIDNVAKTYKIEAFRFLIDATANRKPVNAFTSPTTPATSMPSCCGLLYRANCDA
jgi:hypothetical protein